MKNIFQKERRKSTIYYPENISKNKYSGPVFGKYIPNTKNFNIISTEKKKGLDKIGFILATNPFKNINIEKNSEYDFSELKKKLKQETANFFTEDIVKGYFFGYWDNDELCFIDIPDFKQCIKEKYTLKLDIFSRNTGILESDIMLKKGVLLVGCGSVGSLFALELARAGVGHFFLVDNDIMAYHNICRHQCGIYDVGKYKTDAVKERILEINPHAQVVTHNCIIQDVSIDALNKFCNKNTIVIGGADNREGDLYANHIAHKIGMPLMSVGCWERAFAGEIFYCLPEGMPNYIDFMAALGENSGRVNQNRKFYTNEENLEKASFEPGISTDINFVTTIGVKLAIDILNIGNPNFTPRLINFLTQYTLVCNTNNIKIGGDMAEIFSYPLQVTTSIEIPYAEI